jgi:hypothetical protein
MQDNLKANTHHAVVFYRTAYLGNPAKVVALYVGVE